MKVFWSWQNDFEPKVCRYLIRDALEEATELATEELGLEAADRPEVDHDTKGTPGMAEISATIFGKINESAIFVADVTPIGQSAAGKALPNPNVLIELGWAMRAIGPERIIGVLNTASGFKPDDLPFDIRHRRIMTYNVPASADKAARAKGKKQLAKDLFEALSANLALHLRGSAATREIEGVAASPDDPSIWTTASDTLEYADIFARGQKKTVPFPPRPRAYIRVIPAQWEDGLPTVNEIERLRNDLALWPADVADIDFGSCEEGFLRVSMANAGNAVMYFDSTGEFWAVQGTAVDVAKRGPSLRDEAVLKHWAQAMRTTFAVFQKFKASLDWRVEVGLVRMEDVRWYGQWDSESPLARKGRLSIQGQFHGWDEPALRKFMTDAYTAMRNLFGVARATPELVDQVLGPNWLRLPSGGSATAP